MSTEQLVGLSALVGAIATIVGMITILVFFSRGGRWGKLNDAASVVLMLSMVPVALLVATIESETVTTIALAVAALGIGAMLAAAVLQAALVAGRVTYERARPATLGAGAVVGLWYLLIGLLAWGTALGGPLAGLAIVAGIGFIAVGYGFAVGGERHPAAAVGGVTLFLASTAFLTWLGSRLLIGDLVVPTWNI